MQVVDAIYMKIGKVGIIITAAAMTVAVLLWRERKHKYIKKLTILDTIGNTPLIYLPKLSKAANCHIYVITIR